MNLMEKRQIQILLILFAWMLVPRPAWRFWFNFQLFISNTFHLSNSPNANEGYSPHNSQRNFL